jgi:SAM-dependent methyltransferase
LNRVRSVLNAVFRGPRTFVVDDVRYRERTTEPLHRALSARGSGYKDYDVLFANRAPVRIRCTPLRLYADVAGPSVLAPYRLSDPIIRPGMRVLDVRCGTGCGAAHIAARVGPSGAVVALDPDHESVRFARRRYRAPNISFEIGGIESVGGELDGAFDAIVAVDWIRPGTDTPRELAALWRVLVPGGPLLLVQPLPGGSRPGGDGLGPPVGPSRLSTPELRDLLHDLAPRPGIEPAETTEFGAIIARRPVSEGEQEVSVRGGPYPPMR